MTYFYKHIVPTGLKIISIYANYGQNVMLM